MTPIKPGYKTSEFWTTVLSLLLSSFVISGKLQPHDVDSLTNAVVTFIGAGYGLYSVVVYIKGRLDLKKTALQSAGQTV